MWCWGGAGGAEVSGDAGRRAFRFSVPGGVALRAGGSTALPRLPVLSTKLSPLAWHSAVLSSADAIRAVCLPPPYQDFFQGTQCWVSGWGYTRPDQGKFPACPRLSALTRGFPLPPHWPCPAPSMPHAVSRVLPPAFIPPLLHQLCTPHPLLLWAWPRLTPPFPSSDLPTSWHALPLLPLAGLVSLLASLPPSQRRLLGR